MQHGEPTVCLISMPFMPITTPALGPSLLKAALERTGIGCDVFYGSLQLVKMFAANYRDSAVFDYSYLASSEDLGELFFAPAMWPATAEQVRLVLAGLATLPRLPYSREAMVLLADRLINYTADRDEFLRRCLAARDWTSYRIVGFSSTFCQNNASLALARLIKESAPDTRIVFGGANCDGPMGEEILSSFPWVDHVLQGEADLTFPVYARDIIDGREPGRLPGLLRRRARSEPDGSGVSPPSTVRSMDELPHPDFADYFSQRPDVLNTRSVSIPVELSRGCWWGAIQHCTFCGLNGSGMAFRSKSPARAIAEISSLVTQWDAKAVQIVDNILDMDYFKDVLPNLEELDLSLFCETKSNLREEHVIALARAGVRDIQPGIESLNTATLRHMRKGARASTQVQLLKWCAEHDVRPLWFYLYGFPGEDERWYANDLEIFPALHHLPPPRNPNPVIIDRFSPMFDDPASYGLSNLRPAWHSEICYAGVSSDVRARLAYHFDADFPDGGKRTYEAPLWDAVDRWRTMYSAGATLHQTVARDCTLVVDARREGRPVAHLLVGIVHDVHRELWSSRTCDQLERLCEFREKTNRAIRGVADDDKAMISPVELDIAMRAVALGARTLEVADGDCDVRGALEVLKHQRLVVQLDERWLALATNRRQ